MVGAHDFGAVDSPFADLENSEIRKALAERLTYSKQSIPHYYVTVRVEMDKLLKFHATLNQVASTKISVNDFIMKAAALAAARVP